MSFSINTQAQALISGTIDAVAETLDITSPNSATSIIQLTGTWSGSLVVEGSNDDTNWNSIYTVDSNTQLFQDSITTNGFHTAPTNGFQSLRIRSDAWTSGTVQINVYGSDAASFIKTDSQIRGATNGNLIGNLEDRLKVDISSSDSSNIIPTLGTNLYYDDMNTNSGGVARDTVITNTWTKIYDSTLAPIAGDSGLMLGILITLENFDTTADKSWVIRMVVDGQEVYGTNGILASDLVFVDKYGMNNTNNTIIPSWGGFNPRQDTFRWDAPVSLPIKYNSGVQVYIKKLSEDRRFRAGLACLTKD